MASVPQASASARRLLDTTSRQKTFRATNNGDAHLTISALRVVGTDPADFRISFENCTGESFAVGESCTVGATFTPTAAGARSASLRIISNASNSPNNVPLTGTGTVPTCGGLDATIVGTPGPDAFVGTAGHDIVALLGGDDSFSGDAGNDVVCGDSGDDRLNGQAGADRLRGGSGDDDLRGEASNDTIHGGSEDDDLFGGSGPADGCHGGSDTDTADVACETVTGIP